MHVTYRYIRHNHQTLGCAAPHFNLKKGEGEHTFKHVGLPQPQRNPDHFEQIGTSGGAFGIFVRHGGLRSAKSDDLAGLVYKRGWR